MFGSHEKNKPNFDYTQKTSIHPHAKNKSLTARIQKNVNFDPPCIRPRTSFCLDFVKAYICRFREKYCYTSGENVTFLNTLYLSLGMTKTSSNRQQVVLEYVYLVVSSGKSSSPTYRKQYTE